MKLKVEDELEMIRYVSCHKTKCGCVFLFVGFNQKSQVEDMMEGSGYNKEGFITLSYEWLRVDPVTKAFSQTHTSVELIPEDIEESKAISRFRFSYWERDEMYIVFPCGWDAKDLTDNSTLICNWQ